MLAAFALLLQVWLPYAHHPRLAMELGPRAASYARLAALFGGELALCLPGTKKLSSLPAKAPPREPAPCPMCLALGLLGGIVPPAGGIVIASVRPAAPPDLVGRAPIVERLLNPTSRPRAPPVAA